MTRELARRLTDGGFLSPEWRPHFEAVRRADYLPDRVWERCPDGYRPLSRADRPARWREMADADLPVVTQVADPSDDPALTPTSSASMPRVVATMLAALDVHDGHRVLEAGTGTGYNAALVSDRLGSAGLVTVEADAGLAGAARRRLDAAGYRPTVVVGDAGQGHADGAPYDRVIVTYAVRHVPPALIRQTRPGGVLVLPWGTGLYNGVLARLTVHDDGSASGHVIGDCAFMWDRARAPLDVMASIRGAGTTGRTGLDPRAVLGVADAAFAVGTQLPDVRFSVGHGPDGEFTLWLADGLSWASVDHEPDAEEFAVEQRGPRSLWEEITRVYEAWREAGAPARTARRVTVDRRGRLTARDG